MKESFYVHSIYATPFYNMKFTDSTQFKSDFSDMGLNPLLLRALASLKIVKPTPIQSEAIAVAVQGADLVGVAQTGSGKTLAYALPLLTRLYENPDSRGLILLPQRETAEQVYRLLMSLTKESPLAISLVISGRPNALQVKELKKNPRVIIATPGRLVEHLKGNKLLLKGLDILVLDEADRVLDMGFESQLQFIKNTLRGAWQTLMFAASFGAWAEPVAEMFMRPGAFLIRAKSAETPVETLTQKIYFLAPGQRDNRLRDEIRKMRGGIMIFTDSMESCVTVGRFLQHHNFSCDFMHGDMNPGHRNRVLREFSEEKIQILVTTDLLARGLDIPHIQHVISYELPYKAEDYLHRIGRTARAGREGSALTFVTPSDGRTFRKMKPYLVGAKEETIAKDFKFLDK